MFDIQYSIKNPEQWKSLKIVKDSQVVPSFFPPYF